MSHDKKRTGLYVAILALAAVALSFEPTLAATKRVCQSRLSLENGWGETKRGAKAAARANWQRSVRARFGVAWADWGNSKGLKVNGRLQCASCSKRRNADRCRGNTYGYHCHATAKACKLVQSGPSCKPFRLSGVQRAATERLAKDLAERAWELEATRHPELDDSWTVWRNGRDRKHACWNCSRRKHQDADVCRDTPGNGKYVCVAHAAPCVQ